MLEGDIWPDDKRYGENVPVVGAALHSHRTTREMSQARLAELTGVSRHDISRFEKGGVVRVSHLERMAEVFEVPLEELLRKVKESEP